MMQTPMPSNSPPKSNPFLPTWPKPETMKKFLLTLATIGVPAFAQVTEWKTYRDDIVGYSVTYPGFLHLIPPSVRHPEADQHAPWIWRTKSFQSADGKVELSVETHPIGEPKSLEQFFNEKLAGRASGGDQIEYSLRKDNWYVISGVNTKGFEFYEKFYKFSDSDGSSWYIYFDFVYPHSEHAKYDPMVATIAKGFNPRLPGHNYEH
jgi:hypothetical protein